MNFVTQREGWLGKEYVRLYAESDRARIAEIYDFASLLPGYTPWGSWGLDALCLGPDGKFYLVPWIPLNESHRQEHCRNAENLEAELLSLHEATPDYEHFRKEIHFVTPLAFGGNPADPNNVKMVDQQLHAQACSHWNKVYVWHKSQGR